MEAILEDFTTLPDVPDLFSYTPTDGDFERPAARPDILSTPRGVEVYDLVKFQIEPRNRLPPGTPPPGSPSGSKAARFVASLPLAAAVIAEQVQSIQCLESFGAYILMVRLIMQYDAAMERLNQFKHV